MESHDKKHTQSSTQELTAKVAYVSKKDASLPAKKLNNGFTFTGSIPPEVEAYILRCLLEA